MTVEESELDLGVHTAERDELLAPYERLFHDALIGDQTLFTRADGVERVWELAAPLLAHPPKPQPDAQGSWGPAEAEALTGSRGWELSSTARITRRVGSVTVARACPARAASAPAWAPLAMWSWWTVVSPISAASGRSSKPAIATVSLARSAPRASWSVMHSSAVGASPVWSNSVAVPRPASIVLPAQSKTASRFSPASA